MSHMPDLNVSRRTALTTAASLVGIAGVTACSGASATQGASSTSKTAAKAATTMTTTTPPIELPGGGRTIFPAHRLFGWCGAPDSPALGQLGVGDLGTEMDKMIRDAPQWGDGRAVLPVAELIATVVQSAPGRDGLYRTRMADSVIDTWLAEARKRKALLLLNIQPGRARFIDEARAYEKWLVEPDVGLALDPEWAIGPGQRPGRVFGSMTGAQVDEVAAYLSGLVQKNDLPEKALIVHVLRTSILTRPEGMRQRPGVALVKSVDGIGGPESKTSTYNRVMAGTPAWFRPGFKLFYTEDSKTGPLMTTQQVLALTPKPDYVLFE
ncbi:MAG: hypothetical protein ABI360_08370 [Allobranchiibius sp.]